MEKFFETIILAAFFGAILKIIAHRIRIPAIIPLLLGGILLGPYVLNIIKPSNIGEGFRFVVSVSIGIILFEGALSLEAKGYKRSPSIIRKLLTIGVIITWITTAVMAKLLLNFSISYSLLLGSMIIVTGPTVITPLLQRIRVKQKLKQILSWEAVLIDPIGVFIAILCFEWLTIENTYMNQLLDFTIRLLTGSAIGLITGLLLYYLLNKRIIPLAHNITFTLSFILVMYFASNYVSYESGLLAVVVAGFTFGLKQPHGITHIRHFKLELSELALAVLFVLLSANLNLDYFVHLNYKEIILILIVVFLVRPLSILVCSFKSTLTIKERIFLSWISPRGIVAASMASLFAIELRILGKEHADFIEVFVYAIIILTVILQGFTADTLAKLLNLKIEEEKGWLFVGAHRFSRYLAMAIENHSSDKCFIIDTNMKSVYNAQEKNLKAYYSDALVPEDLSAEVISSIRNLIVLTDNEELNVLICEKWRDYIKPERMYRWTEKLMEKKNAGQPIWNSISKPSQISVELKERTHKVLAEENKKMVVIKLSNIPLFEINKEKNITSLLKI